MKIPTDRVKELRKQSGAGIMECKNVLLEAEVNCETDFAARTDELKELAHHLAMQVAAMPPQFISREEVPEGADIEVQAACLLLQPYIKSPDMTVQDIIAETIAKVGENIKVSRFTRFELGE